jgi:hypothetical protein
MLFVVKKQLEHGTANPIVARLSLQPLDILKQCNVSKEKLDKIAALYTGSLVKQLLRCWEIEQRLRQDYEKAYASFKPAGPGEPAQEVPQIPRLQEECENFLYAAKNYLRDLLQVFNLLHGTDFKEASEWYRAPKGGQSVMQFAAKTFGANHVNTKYFNQIPACIQPFVEMRNAVEHPGGYSGELKITNIELGPGGTLLEPTWTREKNGKAEYGPLKIIEDMRVAVHNLLILGEDVLIMWALTHLSVPGMMGITVIREPDRDPQCPTKYRVGPSAALLAQVAKIEGAKVNPRRSLSS